MHSGGMSTNTLFNLNQPLTLKLDSSSTQSSDSDTGSGSETKFSLIAKKKTKF